MKTSNNTFKSFISFIIISFLTISAFGHYGPRGLTGGSITTGIHYNGFVYLGTKDAGVFVSTNTQLVGWRLRAVGLKSGAITALTHSGKELYAATADSGVFIFNGAIGSDLYWNKRNSGLTDTRILSLAAIDTNTILAGSESGLFKTINKGVSWTAISSNLLNNKEVTALAKAGSRVIALTISGGVFASDDNGDTWFDFNDVNTSGRDETEKLSYNSATDQLLVSNENGLFVLASASTTNAPVYTSAQTGLTGTPHIHNLSNNGTNWYIASHSGVFTTPASSINWVAANTGLPSTNIGVVVPVNDTTLIAGLSKRGAFKSSGAGITWISNNTGLTNINTYSVAGAGDSLVVAATEYGFTVSKDIGLNPVIRNNGLTDSLNINDVEIGDGWLFAATKNGGVFASSNEGLTWTAQNTGLSNLNVKRIIVGNGRKYAIDNDGKVFQADLTATTWTAINAGLPNNAKATSLGFYANQLILGTYGDGVFVKNRDAATWTSFNTGLTDLKVTGVTSSAGKIFAGTDGSGVFVTDASTAAWSATTPISIPHYNAVPGLNPNHIQYIAAVKDYVLASYKGGIVATSDAGNTWGPGGNQFHLPSYSNYHKIDFVTSRIFVTTETNNPQANGITELEFIDTVLVVNEQAITVPASGTTSIHDVTSNVRWQILSAAAWVTLSTTADSFSRNVTLQVAANTGAPRTATVTLSSGTIVRTIEVSQDGTSGVNDLTASKIQLYPNPFSNELVIERESSLENATVVLQDIAGRTIQSQVVSNSNEIRLETSALNSGIYIIRLLENGDNILTQRVSKSE